MQPQFTLFLTDHLCDKDRDKKGCIDPQSITQVQTITRRRLPSKAEPGDDETPSQPSSQTHGRRHFLWVENDSIDKAQREIKKHEENKVDLYELMQDLIITDNSAALILVPRMLISKT